MAYIYLLNLYDMIDDRIKEKNQAFKDITGDFETKNHIKGQIEALSEFKIFLSKHLDEKLPKRIRKQLRSKQKERYGKKDHIRT